jgi:ankyrin repeat protein
MPTRPLPNNPSFEHLRKDAKRLRNAVLAGEANAVGQVEEFHPRGNQAVGRFSLADAQLVTARSHGFATWTKLKQHLDEIAPFIWNPPPPPNPESHADVFLRLACLTYAGWHQSNPAKALRMLDDHPELADANIYTAAAVGDVATVRTMIDRDPALVNATGGSLHWDPLLYACYSRLPGSVSEKQEHAPSRPASPAKNNHDSRIAARVARLLGARSPFLGRAPSTDPNRATLEVARLLLSRGADPNAGFLYAGSYAFTALTGAFGRGEDWSNQPPHPECDRLASVLLEAGADPNDAQTLYNRHFEENDDHLKLLFRYGLGQDKGGPWLKRLNDPFFNPSSLLVIELCAAAQHNFFSRVKLLVEHGVDVNTPGLRNRRTPYEEALRGGHHAIVEYLLLHGAKPIDLDPLETFAIACIAGRREEARGRLAADPALLQRLGHKGRVDLLHRAVDAKQEEGVRLIVELGVDINGMVPGTGLDRSALHNAAGWGGFAMVKLLLELGADPALRDPTYQSTPIGWAFHNRQHAIVEHLLAFASIFDALRCDGVERVAALLQGDPSLAHVRDEEGHPLVFYLHPEMARLEEMLRILVVHGATLNAQNGDGRTLLDRALARGWIEFANILRRYGARTAAESSAGT